MSFYTELRLGWEKSNIIWKIRYKKILFIRIGRVGILGLMMAGLIMTSLYIFLSFLTDETTIGIINDEIIGENIFAAEVLKDNLMGLGILSLLLASVFILNYWYSLYAKHSFGPERYGSSRLFFKPWLWAIVFAVVLLIITLVNWGISILFVPPMSDAFAGDEVLPYRVAYVLLYIISGAGGLLLALNAIKPPALESKGITGGKDEQ